MEWTLLHVDNGYYMEFFHVYVPHLAAIYIQFPQKYICFSIVCIALRPLFHPTELTRVLEDSWCDVTLESSVDALGSQELLGFDSDGVVTATCICSSSTQREPTLPPPYPHRQSYHALTHSLTPLLQSTYSIRGFSFISCQTHRCTTPQYYTTTLQRLLREGTQAHEPFLCCWKFLNKKNDWSIQKLKNMAKEKGFYLLFRFSVDVTQSARLVVWTALRTMSLRERAMRKRLFRRYRL